MPRTVAQIRAEQRAKVAKMIKLYEEGLGYRQIGEQLGVSHSAIGNQLAPRLTPEQRHRHKERRMEARMVPYMRVREQVIPLIASGMSRPEIKRDYGLTQHELAVALRGGLPATTMLRRQQARNGRQAKYSRAEKLAALQETAALANHPQGLLRITVYERLRHEHPDRNWPSAETYMKSEPGWRGWLEAAGIPTSRRRKPRRDRFSETECRQAVKRVAKQLGRSFTTTEYNQERQNPDSEPSASTISMRYGGENHSWMQALLHLAPELFPD